MLANRYSYQCERTQRLLVGSLHTATSLRLLIHLLSVNIITQHHCQAISSIVIDATIPWSVCLSRSCTVLKRQKILTWFLLHMTAKCLPQI